ncbi:MAG TPA: hypothetical protein VM120_03150, partial [Bryobacteraceae bacterium]|nr:hypothetical protein [Bryobacteraceae bacterium]
MNVAAAMFSAKVEVTQVVGDFGLKHRGFLLLCVVLALLSGMRLQGQNTPGYEGPAVSSRGMRTAGSRGAEPVSIRPYASVLGVFDNGLLGAGLEPNGDITNPGALYGIEANLGAYGTKSWRKALLGLDYQGNYRYYPNNSFYSGSDHLLSLDYRRQLTRRTSFGLKTTAGTSSRPVGGVFAFGGADPSILGIPLNDIFDNRAYFADIMGSFTMHLSRQNSLSIGGAGFAVRRQSKVLIGLNGQRALAEYSRRLSRTTAIGLDYQFFHVDYPRVFGEADVHSLKITLKRTFGRRWVLALGAGGNRTDFAAIREVTLDPVVAELLGRSSGREAFNAINHSPALNADVMRAFRRSLARISYSRGANPGNGILLLNRMEALSGS